MADVPNAPNTPAVPSVEWTPEQIDALFQVEMRRRLAEAEKLEAEARIEEIKTEREIDKRDLELAADDKHLVYQFSGEVSTTSVNAAIGTLAKWSRLNANADIEVVFYSPGGSIVAGMALYDFIRSLSRAGHKVTTRARGYAASMAGILLQAGDHRIMESESWLLIHEGSGGAIGNAGEIEDTVEWFKKMRKRIVAIFAARSNLTARTIEKNWSRKDWWLDADEAKKHGFCDEVQ